MVQYQLIKVLLILEGHSTAGTINLGVAGTAAGTDVAIVDITAGTLGNAADTAKNIAASQINILDGAKVSAKDAASKIAGTVKMTGGVLEVTSTKSLAIEGTLTATGGKLLNNGTTLTLSGDASLGGELVFENKGVIDLSGAKSGRDTYPHRN